MKALKGMTVQRSQFADCRLEKYKDTSSAVLTFLTDRIGVSWKSYLREREVLLHRRMIVIWIIHDTECVHLPIMEKASKNMTPPVALRGNEIDSV